MRFVVASAVLAAVARAQLAHATTVPPAEQWVSAGGIRAELDSPLAAGLGSRLAALERAGYLESMCRGASWDLRRRYDVVWRLVDLDPPTNPRA